MNDIKRIIQGIECCLAINDKDCTVCPYDTKEPLCTQSWMAEALEVLKEIDAGKEAHNGRSPMGKTLYRDVR